MKYCIKKDGGKTVLFDGLLFFSTSLAPQTIFGTLEEAEKYQKKSQERWPESTFEIVEMEGWDEISKTKRPKEK